MTKEKKYFRKNFRFTKQIVDMLDERATDLRCTENKIAEEAIFIFLSDKNNFIICTNCDAYVFQKNLLPGGETVIHLICNRCSTNIWYDTDNNKILKSKK